MTRKQETTIMWVIAIILLLIIFSCRTRKDVVTETIHTHDTVMVHKTDTVREIKLQIDSFIDWKLVTIHDTVYHEKEKELVLNEQGDTIKHKEKENLWHKTHENQATQHSESHTDSTAYYKAENERLRQALVKEQSKEKIVKKSIAIPWWAWVTTPIILTLGIFYVAKYIANKKWHNT